MIEENGSEAGLVLRLLLEALSRTPIAKILPESLMPISNIILLSATDLCLGPDTEGPNLAEGLVFKDCDRWILSVFRDALLSIEKMLLFL